MLHREKSNGNTCPKKNSAPPQKFNGPLLSNVNNNSDGKLGGTFLASVAASMIQWHMPRDGTLSDNDKNKRGCLLTSRSELYRIFTLHLGRKT